MDFYRNVKVKIKLLIEQSLTDENLEIQRLINDVDYEFAKSMAPENFDYEDANNVLIKNDVTFEQLCSLLESIGCVKPGALSAAQFYIRLEHYKNKNKTK